MTRLEALEQCLDAVLSGTEERIIHHGAFCLDDAVNVDLAYACSINAARALHDAVLPDWFVARLMEDPEGKGWMCHLEPRNAPGSDWVDADSDNPARAWLIAILKALIAEERDK